MKVVLKNIMNQDGATINYRKLAFPFLCLLYKVAYKLDVYKIFSTIVYVIEK